MKALYIKEFDINTPCTVGNLYEIKSVHKQKSLCATNCKYSINGECDVFILTNHRNEWSCMYR